MIMMNWHVNVETKVVYSVHSNEIQVYTICSDIKQC